MPDKPTCGLVMPIAGLGDYSADHWAEVQRILKESADGAGFEASLVSEAEESGIIQKRIVSKLYNSDIVIADVSGKNPNVMFELGMRLAFDKPAIIVKDESTQYSFDTGVIEHIVYPSTLHYYNIIEFKALLSRKITATHEAATTDKNYTTFLKHFGEYTVAKIAKEEVDPNKFILTVLEELRNEIIQLRKRPAPRIRRPNSSELREVARFFVEQYLGEQGLTIDVAIERPNDVLRFLEGQRVLRDLAGERERLVEAMFEVFAQLKSS